MFLLLDNYVWNSLQKYSAEAEAFCSYFAPKAKAKASSPPPSREKDIAGAVASEQLEINLADEFEEIFHGYISDMSEDEWEEENEDQEEGNEVENSSLGQSLSMQAGSSSELVPPVPKCHKLDIPLIEMKKRALEAKQLQYQKALEAIEKLIASKKSQFDSGNNGLQAYRARAIQSCLRMFLQSGKKKRRLIDASERAAESHHFAAKWGGRMIRSWVSHWLKSRELPESKRGKHNKISSILDDPAICTELRSHLRTNKWSMNPQKLSEFTKNKLLPDEAKKYLHQIVEKEMPTGLKKYMELELFPWIQMKVAKGISLRTACCWLHKEGFKYTAYKKVLYYDGPEREDVVLYRQEVFILKLRELGSQLVQYTVGDVDKEVEKIFPEGRKLVLVAHDEMTAQAHDGQKMSWVWQGEQPLKKKGAGRGLHQSDFICSTVGWLKEASKTLEYGKNHDGFWNGELFVKQVSHYSQIG